MDRKLVNMYVVYTFFFFLLRRSSNSMDNYPEPAFWVLCLPTRPTVWLDFVRITVSSMAENLTEFVAVTVHCTPNKNRTLVT